MRGDWLKDGSSGFHIRDVIVCCSSGPEGVRPLLRPFRVSDLGILTRETCNFSRAILVVPTQSEEA